jgi:hypothetical protein
MTFLPIDGDAPSPYTEWFSLRDELVPFVGERAFALFAFAISQENASEADVAYFRAALGQTGTDADHPQVTETEQLLIDWGRLLARDPRGLSAEMIARVEKAFNPRLRLLLVRFAGLMIATNLVATVSQA